jgi:predicted MFS family arabinose efflux permease
MASPGNVGAYAGLYTMSWSIGQILVSVLGLRLLDGIGFDYYWLFCAALSVLTIFGFYRIIKE